MCLAAARSEKRVSSVGTHERLGVNKTFGLEMNTTLCLAFQAEPCWRKLNQSFVSLTYFGVSCDCVR